MVRARRLDVVTRRVSVGGEERGFVDTLKGVRPTLFSASHRSPGQTGLPEGCGGGRGTGTFI